MLRKRATYNSHSKHSHTNGKIRRGAGCRTLGGCFGEPALRGEEDGGPADHFVAGEDLGNEVKTELVEVGVGV